MTNIIQDKSIEKKTVENITENPIEIFYRQEVHKNIHRIESALKEIAAKGFLKDELRAIINGCMQIMDLGMIHGYDGVEAIAELMYAAARYCALNGEESLEKNKKRLDDAMQTLRQVVELSEESSARSYVDETNTKMDFQIDDIIALEEQDADSEEYIVPLRNRKSITAENEDGLFEIKEFTAVRKIKKTVENSEPQPQEPATIDENELAAEFEKDESLDEAYNYPDYMQAFEEGEVTVIESTLDDITLQKVLADLDQIESAIDKMQKGQDDSETTAAIQEIREATSDLRAISEEEAMQPIAEIIYPMERIASEKLRSEVAAEAIDVLQECTRILREYLDNHELSLAKLTALRSEFNSKLFVGERKSPFESIVLDESAEDEDDRDEIQIIKTPLVSKLRKLFGMY